MHMRNVVPDRDNRDGTSLPLLASSVYPLTSMRALSSQNEVRSQGIVPVAAGDLKCEGLCSSGGSWGSTGMYNIGGRNLCHSCAVKILRIENLSPVEQMKRLQEHLK
jgi:hypothetical protein